MAPRPVLQDRSSLSSSTTLESSLELFVTRSDLNPSEVFRTLTARDGPQTIPPDHSGAVDPNSINMKGLQALFAIIGAAFVLASIWFFFWAKNGGFHFRKGDWDEYKSTVLRRKGPNGTTLSNATKSTKLGGGSIIQDGYSDRDGSSWGDGTMTETMTDLSSEAPIIKENQKTSRKETAKERKIREAKEATWEGGHDNDVRAYRHEKPARVGGINKDSDALHYGTDYTDTDGSVIQSQRPQRHGATRQTKRQSSRRDFSFGNDEAFSAVSSSQPEEAAPAYNQQQPPVPPHRPGRYHSPSKQYNAADTRRGTPQGPRQNIPGGFHDQENSDMQSQHTKSYHHPIPGLSGGQGRGFRRDRRDSFDD